MSITIENETQPAVSWYRRVFEASDLTSTTPELKPFLDVDDYPDWLVNVMSELSRQGLHLSPVRSLADITPRKLGLNLGQKCANYYAVADQLQTAMGNEQNLEKAVVMVEQLENNKENPAVAHGLEMLETVGLLIEELANGANEFEKAVHNAFKEALEQTEYNEAVQFFQGFAQGISSPGLILGKLAQATDATPIYFQMYYHWQEINQLQTVTELYDFLLKVGIPMPMLGDIDRLRTLCKRIKYTPGKRGRPVKTEK